MRYSTFLVMGLTVLLLVAGCTEPSPLVPVEGVVTLDGKPVSELAINFSPEGNTEGNGALGYVGEGGRFSLTDVRGEPGIRVGRYRVSFYPAPQNSGLAADDPAGVVLPPVKTGLPSIYLDPFKSPVIAEVPAGGANIELLLTATGKGATTNTVPRVSKQ